MVNNLTNINKMNNYLSPQMMNIKKKDHDYMMLQILAHARDRHKNVAGVNQLMGSQPFPHR